MSNHNIAKFNVTLIIRVLRYISAHPWMSGPLPSGSIVVAVVTEVATNAVCRESWTVAFHQHL